MAIHTPQSRKFENRLFRRSRDRKLITEIALDIEKNTATAWLYHKDYAVKMGMFGAHIAEGETIQYFIEIVESVDCTEEETAALDAIRREI